MEKESFKIKVHDKEFELNTGKDIIEFLSLDLDFYFKKEIIRYKSVYSSIFEEFFISLAKEKTRASFKERVKKVLCSSKYFENDMLVENYINGNFKVFKKDDFEVEKEIMMLHILDIIKNNMSFLFGSVLVYDESVQKYHVEIEQTGKEYVETLKISERDCIDVDFIYELLMYELCVIDEIKTKYTFCKACGNFYIKEKKMKVCKYCTINLNNGLINKYRDSKTRKDYFDGLYQKKISSKIYDQRDVHNNIGPMETRDSRKKNEKFISIIRNRTRIINKIEKINDKYLYYIMLYLVRFSTELDDETLLRIANDVSNKYVDDIHEYLKSKIENYEADWFLSRNEFYQKIQIQELLNSILDFLKFPLIINCDNNIELKELYKKSKKLKYILQINQEYLIKLGYKHLNLKRNNNLSNLINFLEYETSNNQFNETFIAKKCKLHKKFYRKFNKESNKHK